MNNATKETTPVIYSDAAVKTLHFKREVNTLCFNLHWHDRIEILRVRKGEMTLECYQNTFTLKEGDMIFITPKMSHKGYTVNEGVDYDVLMFDLQTFYNKTGVCNRLFPILFDGSAKFEPVIYDNETVACVDDICNSKDLDSLEIVALVYKLIHLMFKKHLYKITDSPKTNINFAIDFIEENYMHDINNDMLSQKLGYCTEHFCRKFKETTGITPMTYLKIFRLEKSVQILKMKQYTISEIALKCGFCDANYFTRCFKTHYGLSPKKYLKNNF